MMAVAEHLCAQPAAGGDAEAASLTLPAAVEEAQRTKNILLFDVCAGSVPGTPCRSTSLPRAAAAAACRSGRGPASQPGSVRTSAIGRGRPRVPAAAEPEAPSRRAPQDVAKGGRAGSFSFRPNADGRKRRRCWRVSAEVREELLLNLWVLIARLRCGAVTVGEAASPQRFRRVSRAGQAHHVEGEVLDLVEPADVNLVRSFSAT